MDTASLRKEERKKKRKKLERSWYGRKTL